MQVNLPDVVEEVHRAFLAYEQALVSNDVEALDGFFWADAKVLRYGLAENLYGHREIAAFRAGGYERIVTTGGPIDDWPKPPQATFAELAADYLRHHGLGEASITAVPAPAVVRDRTYATAVAVREWARRSGGSPDVLDVYSAGAHARRSLLLYRMAFGPGVRIGVHAARDADYDGATWWRTGIGARAVLEQAVQWFWVKCFFRPAPGPGGA